MTPAHAPAFQPSQSDLVSHEIVKRQFGETSNNSKFFDDFYVEFTEQSPEIAAAFANTDMSSQKEALRSGLAFLIMYAGGNDFAESKLDRLGKTHSRTGYNIRPQMYPLWVNSLIRTVKKHVAGFDKTSESAWRHVLQLGVDRIASQY